MPDDPTDSKTRRYHVALSFAGEDRQYVESVAHELVQARVAVFYDRYEEVSLWGKNLYDHLTHIYSEAAYFGRVLGALNRRHRDPFTHRPEVVGQPGRHRW